MDLFIFGVIKNIKDSILVAIGELKMMDISVHLLGCIILLKEDVKTLKDEY